MYALMEAVQEINIYPETCKIQTSFYNGLPDPWVAWPKLRQKEN